MPRSSLSAKKSSPTVDVHYVVDGDGNQVIAGGEEVVIQASPHALIQRADALSTDKPPLSQKKASLTI